MDNIKSDLKDKGGEGVNSFNLDQGRSKNQTVSNTKDFQVPKKGENFLTG
jgi:hypothetical protein